MKKSALPSIDRPWNWTARSCAFLLAFAIYASFVFGAGPFSHWFIDNDDFTRAERVLQLLSGGSWWDGVLHYVGKSGLELHWTKPNDIVVLIGTWPLHMLGMPAKDAIEYWSFVSPLVILVGFCFAWQWASAPLARSRMEASIFAFASIVLMFDIGYFAPMRIDHHGLIVVMATLLLGFSIRAADRGLTIREAWISGVVAALAIWVSVEELLFVGCFFAGLGAAWVLRGSDRELRTGALSAAASAVAGSVFLFAERGLNVMGSAASEIDRISLFHVGLLGAVAIGWGMMIAISAGVVKAAPGARGVGLRIMVGALGAAIAGCAIYLTHPQVFHGYVVSGVDMAYVEMRAGFIKEGLELVSPAVLADGGWMAIVRALLGKLLAATVGAIGLGVIAVAATRHRGMFSLGWLVIAVWAAVFLVWQGWPTNANGTWLNLLGVAPAAWLMCALARRFGSEALAPTWAALLMLLIGIGHFGLAGSGQGSVTESRAGTLDLASAGQGRCDRRMANDLLLSAGVGPKDVVMAYPDYGPAVIWGTGASVLSIPNHRVQPGFKASWEAFLTRSDDDARAKVAATGATVIMLCDGLAEAPFYALRAADGESFGRRLADRRSPAWLREIPHSDEAVADLRIYVLEGRR